MNGNGTGHSNSLREHNFAPRRLKIGILVGVDFNPSIAARVRGICRALLDCEPLAGRISEIAIGLPVEVGSLWSFWAKELRGGLPEVVVRRLKWELVATKHAVRMFEPSKISIDLTGIDDVWIPTDWGRCFADCDLWLNLTSPGGGPIFPIRPTAHYCHELPQRIFPHDYASSPEDEFWTQQVNAFRFWRQAPVVATSDVETFEDLSGYSGIRRGNILLVPNPLYALIQTQPSSSSSAPIIERAPLVLWFAEAELRYEIAPALEGLRRYLAEEGNLRFLIITKDVDSFDCSKSQIVDALPARLKNILAEIPKEMPKSEAEFLRIASNASGVWSSIAAGGGGDALFRAASLQLHFLGFGLASYRQAGDETGTCPTLYSTSDPLAIADGLHSLERRVRGERKLCPRYPSSDFINLKWSFIIDRLMEHCFV